MPMPTRCSRPSPTNSAGSPRGRWRGKWALPVAGDAQRGAAAGARRAREPGDVCARDFNRILIEGEIAFRLRAPLAADVPPSDAGGIRGDRRPRRDDRDRRSSLCRLRRGRRAAATGGSGNARRTGRRHGRAVARRLRLDARRPRRSLRRRNRERDARRPSARRSGFPAAVARATCGAARPAACAAGDLITAGTWTGVFEARAGTSDRRRISRRRARERAVRVAFTRAATYLR